MIKKMGIDWKLRLRMAERGLYATSDLVPLLSDRGVTLSREQVYRLVTSVPQRLSTDVLAALCDILNCTPSDLITVRAVEETERRPAVSQGSGPAGSAPAPKRTTIRRPRAH